MDLWAVAPQFPVIPCSPRLLDSAAPRIWKESLEEAVATCDGSVDGPAMDLLSSAGDGSVELASWALLLRLARSFPSSVMLCLNA
jgi:hypothetical protein